MGMSNSLRIRIAKAAIKVATAMVPIEVIVRKISFALELQKAKKNAFEAEFDMEVKIFGVSKKLSLDVVIDLTAPMNCLKEILSGIKKTVKKLPLIFLVSFW